MGHGTFVLCLLLLDASARAFADSPVIESSINDGTTKRTSRQVHSYGDVPPLSVRVPEKLFDNHKPVFANCSKYAPTVKEEEKLGTYVMTVVAEDEDPIESGGKLTYKFVLRDGEKSKFNISNDTGVITTNYMFDRDEPSRNKEVYVTVQATDNGRPILADVCTFKITIEDVNDNQPIFDKTQYSESVPQDLPIGREVMRISASDIDDGNNSVVTYKFSDNQFAANEYFEIDEGSGVVTLKKLFTPSDVTKMFKIRVNATDVAHFIETDVEIKVVDSKKKAPSFIEVPTKPIYLEENLRDYDHIIATVVATSNMENKDLQFVMEKGRTEQTNKLSTFIMVSEGDTAYIKLGHDLDYESIVEYTLTIRVQNKDLLNAVTKINIKVKDVNDNIPAFMEVVSGTVLENEDPGTPVMQVQAIDLDGTAANNIVSYELADHNDLFHIDSKTGNITTKDSFDREANSVYNVKVIAKDNSRTALKKNSNETNRAEQVFPIIIEDKNDNKPKFTKSQYVTDGILESTDLHKEVIEVSAKDKDTASVIRYSIKSGNIDDSFSMEEKTGKIRVKNPLDYETTKFYNLTVEAFDGKFTDEAIVHVIIENVNDNVPVFDSFEDEVTIPEETEHPGCLVTVSAYDPDISDRNAPQDIVYSTSSETGDPFLSVDKDGCVRLIKKLDRDPPNGLAKWQAHIHANDENGSVRSQGQSRGMFIYLIDINDNAPTLNVTEVVWYENTEIMGKSILKLTATDNDGPENGPPFNYKIANDASDEIVSSFKMKGDLLYPLVVFDREYKKEYIVPIEVTDSGKPPMTGLSYLKVIIGDINDNSMGPGSSEILVNSFPNMPKTTIGRIYVEDLDDWDLPDKQFYWYEEDHSQFHLDRNTGNITMLMNTDPGVYHLRFRVYEEGQLIVNHTVEANVTVTVKSISDEAIKKSGSIRLYGQSAEDFIKLQGRKSMKDEMHKHLTHILNVTSKNLDIVSILHSPVHNNKSLLDVRFSAHGSPYYYPEKLNTITTLNQEKLYLNDIEMVNVAECMYENVCPGFSCTNYLNISEVPYVVNTNRTSFVGLSAVVEPKCTCHIDEPLQCFNGGNPIENSLCDCPDGFEGPHCELISIGFNGNGWALYPTFETCNNSELTLELVTLQENGLIFYVGPLRKNPRLPVQDFMSLELKDGYPVLLVDYGTGTVQIEQKYKKLNDGNNHFIYITFQPNSIELRVDNCHMSACVKLAAAPGPNKALNVNGPLQLGGSVVNLQRLASDMNWSFIPTDESFIGGIRNLTYNGKTYNLGAPSYAKNVNLQWSGLIVSSASFGIDSNFLVALLVCIAILLILLLAVVVHRKRQENWSEKDMDDIRENIINYEDEGGGEVDTGFDLDVLRRENYSDDPIKKRNDNLYGRAPEEVPDISGFLEDKKESCDKDPDFNPFDDVRYYAYEGDGNTSRSSLSSLASCTDEGDLKFNYLSNFGPRFRKLADMYGEEPSDEEDQEGGEESWC